MIGIYHSEVEQMSFLGNRTNILIVGIVLCACILLMLFSERIPQSGGLGYDGAEYGRMVKEFEKFPHIPQLDNIYARRIFPSGVIYSILTALNLPRNNINIIHAFQIYNIVLFVLVAYIWVLISDELQISNKGKWLGFMGLFLNNAVLKFYFYYPVLTDVSAFFLGILMFYFWLRDNKVGLVVVAFIGAFTWPTLIYQGLVLYIFPRKKVGWEQPRYYLNYLLGIIAGLAFLGGAAYFTNGFTSGFHHTGFILFPKNNSLMSCITLSVALCVLYAFMVVRNLFDNNYFFSIKRFILDIRFARLFVALLGYGLSLALIEYFINVEHYSLAPQLLTRVFSAGTARPFEFYIAHVFYFGPILILTFWFFGSFCKAVQSFGWGLLLVCLMNLVLTINPVSRSTGLTAFYPVIVVLTVLSVDKYILDDSFLKYFAVISLLLSRVWLSYNWNVDWCAAYFNNYGTYMNNQWYFVQAAVVVFLLFMGYFYLRNNIERAR